MIGRTLGPYQVLSKLGEGGMGEVYQATDTNLGRRVAIKVLPAAVASDPERLARFDREARTLAALNHPNIAQIYGLEKADDITALVMELIEGPTLADLIAGGHPEAASGGLKLDDALAIARQIALALEAAHEQGIIHRDLKPANIKVRDDGTVKVLDFGLAKATGPAGSSGASAGQALSMSPTITTPAHLRQGFGEAGTQMGMILGTAAYMAPEQARGRPVDKRADIWAFGCVLYEMLTGRRAFEGEDVSATLADVIRGDPDWTRLPEGLPATLVAYLRRCLEKDPTARVRDIGDVRLALDGAFDLEAPVGQAQPAAAPRRRVPVAAVAAVALMAGVLAGRGWFAPDAPRSVDVTRSTVPVDAGRHLSGGSLDEGRIGLQRPSRLSFALSPDGRQLVYVATDEEATRLFLRPLSRARATPLAGTEGASTPIFSPDGDSVAFLAGGEAKRIDLATSDVRTVAVEGGGTTYGATWAEDDTFVVGADPGIVSVPSYGGTPTVLVERDSGEPLLGHPSLLPGGRAVLFNVATSSVPSEWDIVVESLETGERHVVVSGGSDPRYVPTGHLLFVRRGALMAVPFDVDELRATADPVVVVEDVMQAEGGANSGLNTGIGQFSVSRSGTLLYVPGGIYPPAESELTFLDRGGTIAPVGPPPARYLWPRFSPDGERLAYGAGGFGDLQLWVYDMALAVARRLTTEGENMTPVWSPDGLDIAFARRATQADPTDKIFVVAADGSGTPRELMSGERLQVGAWSEDGVLVFQQGPDLWTLKVDGSDGPRPFLETPDIVEAQPVLSPDSRWLAYTSNEAGPLDVYVRPFPGGEPAYRVSTDGGNQPVWSPDGRQLYWTAGSSLSRELWAVDVTPTDGRFSRSRPRLLVDAPPGLAESGPIGSLDVSPTDGRFVGLWAAEIEPQPVTRIEVVQNWFEELKRLAPTE